MSAVEAVCFDLDDTLAVHDQDSQRLLSTSFDRAGVDPLFDVADVSAVDPATLPTAESDQEFFELLFSAAARRTGIEPSPGDVASVAETYLDVYDPAAVSFREGAREALVRARERYDVALVTNGGKATQVSKLETLEIRDAFDVEVYCDPGAGIEPKPDPGPLERALAELGRPADAGLVVGDGLGTDVAGAHAAGMRSAWVPFGSSEPDPEPEPTYTLDSMSELTNLL